MAWLFKRPKSPYWWVGWTSPDGRQHRKSTGCQLHLAADTRRAREIRAKHELDELRHTKSPATSHWDTWVPAFLDRRYRDSPASLARYTTIWRTLRAYLAEIEVHGPGQLTRDHCLDYVPWRRRAGHMNSRTQGRLVSHNTARLELTILSVILSQAVEAGMIPHNPARDLKVRKQPPKKARELTAEDHLIVSREIRRRLRAALQTRDPAAIERADFLRRSWQIASWQGIRLAETVLPLEAFNLAAGTYTRTVKGGRAETTALHPRTARLVERLLRLGRTHTCAAPAMPSLEWFKFFHSLRQSHPQFKLVSHRSLRVTLVSRLLRGGVPADVVGRLVGHRSIHTTAEYRRINPAELTRAWAALK